MDPNADGDPSDGVDGWRLDVADMVSMNFWREFRQWVRGINPEAYITGEVWWEDWGKDKIYNAERWLRGDAFDAVMNYRWAREVCRYFIDRKGKITASEFLRRLDSLRADYRPEVNFVLMNLLDSHDTDRLLSRIVNPDMAYDHNVGLHDNPAYDPRKPKPAEIAVQKLIALFQMTSLGAPMVYYGDEAGMWGGDDPDERKPMLWADARYANERSHPFGKSRPDDPNAFDTSIFASYQKLIRLRSQHPALQSGTMSTLLADDANDCFVFTRSAGGEQLVVAVNNASVARTVVVPAAGLGPAQGWVDLLTGTSVIRDGSGLRLLLAPKSGTVVGAMAGK
jgi:glycosidase